VNNDDAIVVAVTLAEAETLRLMLHTNHPVLQTCQLSLMIVSCGVTVDSNASSSYVRIAKMRDSSSHPRQYREISGSIGASGLSRLIVEGLLCLRFYNGDMFYSTLDISILQSAFAAFPFSGRVAFFAQCLRLRNRLRNMWVDTPIAALLAPDPEELRKARCEMIVMRARVACRQLAMKKGVDVLDRLELGRRDLPSTATTGVGSNGSGGGKSHVAAVFQTTNVSSAESAASSSSHVVSVLRMAQLLVALHIDLPTEDAGLLASYLDRDHDGFVDRDDVISILRPPAPVQARTLSSSHANQEGGGARWICRRCTVMNAATSTVCSVCEAGWTGVLECPPDKWACSVESGGCSYFNPKTTFYCVMCNRARPDLMHVRF